MNADNIFVGFESSHNNISGAFEDNDKNGGGAPALAGAAAMGFAPFPFNPFFIPIQMTMFIILIIILLYWGVGFFTAALLAYIIPAILMTVFHYYVITGTVGRVVSL